MLCHQAIDTQYPFIENNTEVAIAKRLMDKEKVYNLPVVENEILIGIISRNQLEDMPSHIVLDTNLRPLQIAESEHICSAMSNMITNHLQILPVFSIENKYLGVITSQSLLEKISMLMGCNESPGALITLEMDRHNFSFGELSRLVETNDAGIVQLNTYTEPETGHLIVNFRINKSEVSDIVATLQRYDYTVRYFFGKEIFENELKQNYDALMNYLNI